MTGQPTNRQPTNRQPTNRQPRNNGRLAKLPPERLDPPARELYDRIVGGPRGHGPQPFGLTDPDGALEGPFDAMLRSPALGMALQELGTAIRYRTTLPARARELAILLVAAHWDSAFERHAHEAAGRSVGLTEAELAAARRGEPPPLTDPVEAAAVHVTRALIADADLDDATYATARDSLGETGLLELTTLVGYYTTLALQLRVFRVPAPQPVQEQEYP